VTWQSDIRAIAEDRLSGAAELALRAAEVLRRVPPHELPEAADAVMRAQPAMAAVYNAARAAQDRRLNDFAARLRNSAPTIAAKAASLVCGKVVLTHSYSSTVVRALQAGSPARILCTESEPGGEGRRTAELLRGFLVADADIESAMGEADVVAVGADAVTPEWVVNKVGTGAIARAAAERGVPAWVLCGSEKFVGPEWRPQVGQLFERVPRELFTGIVDDA
jgi:translation initiation factor 2B subunit (eIF-2B alpha/beta/delta family)